MIMTGMKFMIGCMIGWLIVETVYYIGLFLIFIIGEGIEELNKRIRK
jgi:hypothetical protein